MFDQARSFKANCTGQNGQRKLQEAHLEHLGTLARYHERGSTQSRCAIPLKGV